MEKVKCHICKASNKGETCTRCGADLSRASSEKLVLSSGGYTFLEINGEHFSKMASCKAALTNQRFVIYKIKPEAENPAFGLFKDLLNAIKKNPYISINLADIELIRRYSQQHLIFTREESYCVWLSKFKELDELFKPYKSPEEQ
ncbi:MAG: hypothetical protein LBS74_01715 [Oscillospiraceae bacterium]|jgi:hypothetical protein|nr:hypothetical protein [Oscillospiraceae bacterium]